MPDLWCRLCGEVLNTRDEIPYGYHRGNGNIPTPIPLWDSCIRAATGDNARLIRVHRQMAKSEPLLARAYAGDI